MLQYVSEISVDAAGQQTDDNGTAAYPVASFKGGVKGDVGRIHSIMWHWHRDMEIVYMNRGCTELGIDGKFFRFNEGEAAFINSGTLHALRSISGEVSEHHSVVFQPRVIGSVDSIFWVRYVQPLLGDGAARYLLFRPSEDHGHENENEIIALIRAAWEADTSGAPDAEIDVRTNLTKLLMRILRFTPARKQPPTRRELREAGRIRQMIEYITEHYAEEVTVDDIAQAALISTTECIRCFKRSVGTTPIVFLREYRIRRAEDLLRSTSDTVGDIAFACGFQDVSYFTKTFRQLNGITPAAYRAAHR